MFLYLEVLDAGYVYVEHGDHEGSSRAAITALGEQAATGKQHTSPTARRLLTPLISAPGDHARDVSDVVGGVGVVGEARPHRSGRRR